MRERPVFVDRTGRRRRLAVLLGTGLALAFTASFGLLVAGLSGTSGVGVPGLPDLDGRAGVTTAPAVLRTTPPAAAAPPTVRDATTGTRTTTTTSATTRPGRRHTPTKPPHPTKNG